MLTYIIVSLKMKNKIKRNSNIVEKLNIIYCQSSEFGDRI